MANSIGITLEINNQRYIGDIKKAQQATSDFTQSAVRGSAQAQQSFGGLNNATNNLANGFSKLRTLLLGAAFVGFARSAIGLGAQLKDLSDATGITVESLVRLREALSQNSGSADDAGKAVTAFYNKIDEAAQGSESAQSAFARVGVTLNDLRNLSEQDLLRKTIKGLSELPVGAERSALGVDLLGKALRGVNISEDFLQILDEGNEKTREAAEAAAQAAALNDQWSKTWDELRIQFIKAFGPILEGVAKLLKDAPELIGLFKALGAVMIGVFAASGVGLFVRGLAAAAGWAGRLFSLFKGGKAAIGASGAVGTAGGVQGAISAAGGIAALGAGVAGTAVGVNLMTSGQKEMNAAVESKVASAAEANGARQVTAARKVVDALANQREAIKAIGRSYQENSQNAIDRIQQESKMISMSEEAKEAYRERIKVEQDAENVIQRLQEQRSKTNGKLNAEIDAEIAKVKQRRDEVLGTLDQEIAKKNDLLRLDKETLATREAMLDITEKTKDIQDAYLLDTLVGVERQLKQIELAELRARDAALARWEIQNRNLPQDEFVRRREQEVARLNAITEASIVSQQRAVKAATDQQRTFSSGWQKAFKEYTDNATNAAKAAEDIFRKVTSSMEDLIVNFAKTGKFEFKGFINSILEDLLRSQVRQLIAQTFGAFGGGGKGGSLLGNFAGFFANGGTIGAGSFGVVGERGPELVSGPATVTPLSGGASYVTYNINAVDAMSFKQMIAQDPSFIHAVAMQGGKGIPSRR